MRYRCLRTCIKIRTRNADVDFIKIRCHPCQSERHDVRCLWELDMMLRSFLHIPILAWIASFTPNWRTTSKLTSTWHHQLPMPPQARPLPSRTKCSRQAQQQLRTSDQSNPSVLIWMRFMSTPRTHLNQWRLIITVHTWVLMSASSDSGLEGIKVYW